MDIRAADASVGDADEYIVGVGELGDWAVFEGNSIGLVEDKGGVLELLELLNR